MAQIREELTLVDKFSAQFTKFIAMAEKAEASIDQLQASLGNIETASAQTAVSVGALASGFSRAGEEAEQVKFKQFDIKNATDQTARSTDALLSRVRQLASAYLGMKGVSWFIQTSDALSNATARIERMNDGLQTTEQLQASIFRAAQDTRTSYTSMLDSVSRLGTLAGEAFSSSAEVVAFAEQLGKQFALAGTSAEGQAAAMLQLTQAMGSGVLRGEELNSVLEQAPNIVQTIADYMGTTVAGVRELASDGQVTADVVKNALLSAAAETNAAFEEIPMNFSQAWTMASNAAVKAFQPAMEKARDLLNSELGQQALDGLVAGFQALGTAASYVIDLIGSGAQFIADNWSVVSAILVGIGAAALVAGGAMVASGLASAAAWMAANWPLVLIAAAVALVIYLARAAGATWEEIGGVIGGVFMSLYAAVMNQLIIPAWNQFANFANFIGNLFNDPVAAVKVLFLDMADTVLGYLSTIAHAIEDLINKIPGIQVNLTSGLDNFRSKIQAASQEVKDASGWVEYVKKMDYIDYSDAWDRGYAAGENIAGGIAGFDLSSMLDGSGASSLSISSPDLSSIASDTSDIKKAVSLSEEDLSMLADMAERRYVNNINLTSQSPVITIQGANTGDTEADRRGLADAIKRILLEQAASATTNAYAVT